MSRLLAVILLLLLCISPLRADDLGLKLPPGFKITQWADQELANDIYAMTLDNEGRVVVTSRGWVKRLEDTDNDGKADKATVLMETKTGGMGICFAGTPTLYFCGDGWFSQSTIFPVMDPIKQPDKLIAKLAFTEHGGHAMRKGPDGCWYIIYGNSSQIENVKLDNGSPIKKPEAGGILRFSKDMKKIECVAHGYRNPYDFDFTPLGDIITYDSDTERDFLLPWYSPTRMYHVAHGMHHGWRLPGYLQSLARRDYYPDVVDMLWPVGRGSPTGVVCYRHYQFPKHYHGGVFALDWTFGKIYFFHLDSDGSSYKTKAEVFLEPDGINGFAPTDACVAPDGSLFVSIGGRGTRGAVYRIEYVGTKDVPPSQWKEPRKYLDKALEMPQPLDAWARAQWEPSINRIGCCPLYKVIVDENESDARRIRAIEICNDLASGLDLETAEKASASKSWQVRARVAWSLGRDFISDGKKALFRLAKDAHPKVRVEALNALADLMISTDYQMTFISGDESFLPILVESLGHSDKRVRMVACRIAATLPGSKVWLHLSELVDKSSLQCRLTFSIADHWAENRPALFTSKQLGIALEGLKSNDPHLRLEALRLLMLIDGDWCLQNPTEVVYSAYALQKPRKDRYDIESKIVAQLHKLYPTGDAHFDTETSRYFAMIEDSHPESAVKVLNQISNASAATNDVHQLIVLSRLKGTRTPEQTTAVVDALLGLDKKLQGTQLRIKQTWAPRLGEVVANLVKKFPNMPEVMIAHPAFIQPAHISFALALSGDSRKKAARLFLEAAKKEGDSFWSPELVELLTSLPKEEYRPAFRTQWSDYGLREAILPHLLKEPEVADRGRIFDGLDSGDKAMVIACLSALQKLPPTDKPEQVVGLLRRLRLSCGEAKDGDLRVQLLAEINRQMKSDFKDLEPLSKGPKSTAFDAQKMRLAYEPVFTSFEKKHPEAAKLLRGDEEDAEHWKKLLTAAPWEKGDADRGQKLFRSRSCAVCHTGSSRIGPDLTGVAGRFSRDDLFTAIISPSRDVAPAYRVNEIETQDGKRFAGMVIFESAEGIIVQTGATTTIRIDAGNLFSRKPSTKSLMPVGLLKDLKSEDLADLYAYLKSLKAGP